MQQERLTQERLKNMMNLRFILALFLLVGCAQKSPASGDGTLSHTSTDRFLSKKAIEIKPYSISFEEAKQLGIPPDDKNRTKILQIIERENVSYCPVGESQEDTKKLFDEKNIAFQQMIDSLRRDEDLTKNLIYYIYNKDQQSLSELQSAFRLLVAVSTEYTDNAVRDMYYYAKDVGFRYASSWGTLEDVERSVQFRERDVKEAIHSALREHENSNLADIKLHGEGFLYGEMPLPKQ